MTTGRRPGPIGLSDGEPSYGHGRSAPRAGVSIPGPLGVQTDGLQGRRLAFIPRVPETAPGSVASHERILDAAVSEFFTEAALLHIVDGTVAQDSIKHQGMSPEGTAAHSMKSPWASQSAANAVELRDAKIARELAETRVLVLAGKAQAARNKFGRLTHTIQDKFPHAHTAGADGKVPLAWNPFSLDHVLSHARSDSAETMSGENVKAAIAETLVSYETLEAAVLDLPAASGDAAFNPDLAKYDLFLKFRGILITSRDQRKPYLKSDQSRWTSRKKRT